MNRKERRTQKKVGDRSRAGLPKADFSGNPLVARAGTGGISDMLMHLGGVKVAVKPVVADAPPPVDPVHAALTQMRLNDSIAAQLAQQEQALRTHPESAALLHSVARLQVRLDRRADALLTYRRLLAVDAGHAEARHMIAVLSGAAPDQPDESYVEKLFDGFADSFDDKLTNWLEYRAPQQVAAATKAVLQGRADRAIDLGCGTGLLGPEVRALCARLDGVDLSSKMVEKAKARGSYDGLSVGEIVATLGRRADTYDLAFAADVLSYFGDLRTVFSAVHACLHDGGLFVATVEKGMGARYQASKTGRYQHGEAYLRKRAAEAGFGVLSLEEVVLRREENRPVEGFVFALRRLAPDEPGAEIALSTEELIHGLDGAGADILLAKAQATVGEGFTVGWALDLGGYLGRHVTELRHLAQHLDMVSSDEARSRRAFEAGIYDDCDTDEIIGFLESRPDHFDLILAADLSPLRAELPLFFSAVKVSLALAGAFIGLLPVAVASEAELRAMAQGEGLIVLAVETVALPDGSAAYCIAIES